MMQPMMQPGLMYDANGNVIMNGVPGMPGVPGVPGVQQAMMVMLISIIMAIRGTI